MAGRGTGVAEGHMVRMVEDVVSVEQSRKDDKA